VTGPLRPHRQAAVRPGVSPPSFQEFYNVNNPVTLGNPGLDPESISTCELAFDYHTSGELQTSLNLFYYELEDIIRYVPDPAPATSLTAQNSGSQTGYGLELEGRWRFLPKWALQGNFSWQQAEDGLTGEAPGLAPVIRHSPA